MPKVLAGIRIADFTVHAAGPFCTQILAQLGAECIKIESRHRPDIFRKAHAVYGRVEPAAFDHVTAGKLSVRLNLKHPTGIARARSIVAISDAVAENFRAGVMARLGLGWPALSAGRPDLVMVSVSSSGQESPDSAFSGYAPLFGAWGALGTLSGYQDGPPLEMRHIMDHAAGLNGALAVLAGLQNRARHGRGGYYDVAARDVASASIGDVLLEAAAGGEPIRWGNAHPAMSPHGVYPSSGDDCWLTIAVRTDDEWRSLCGVIDRAELAGDARFATSASRLAHREQLDAIVSDWTRCRTAEEAAGSLQGAGIAAHPSWNARDLAADLHLRARGAIETCNLPSGSRPVVRAPVRFSGADVDLNAQMPALGEHEDYVFGDLLKLTRARRTELENEGVIS